METFSALLGLCAQNSPVTGEFPAQRPVTRSFDIFFDLRLNKRVSKQLWGWWFETQSCSLWRHRNERMSAVCLYWTSTSGEHNISHTTCNLSSHIWKLFEVYVQKYSISISNAQKNNSFGSASSIPLLLHYPGTHMYFLQLGLELGLFAHGWENTSHALSLICIIFTFQKALLFAKYPYYLFFH